MSDQDQRDGGFFVVRGGMAVDVTDLVEAAMAAARATREDAGTALSPNRGPTSRSIDIRTPAVARRGDEMDILTA